MLGMPTLPIVVIPPIAGRGPEMMRQIADEALEEVVHVLSTPASSLAAEYAEREFDKPTTIKNIRPDQVVRRSKQRTALIEFSGTFDEFNDFCIERGWGDGLPLVPPTEEAVAKMCAGTDLPRQARVAEIPPLEGIATVESIATNAVMAGCRPEYLPVLIAAVEAMADPAVSLTGLQTTTNPATPLAIVHGPAVERLDFNAGYNLFGPGWRSNATVGRAVRLILLNIGGGTPGVVDRSTLGQPGKYSFCIAENSKESPWEPLHVERGHPADSSAVTVAGTAGPHNILDSGSLSGEELLTMFAQAVSSMHNNIFFPCQPVFIIGPEHAQLIARDGIGKKEAKEILFERARASTEGFSPGIAYELSKRRIPWFENAKNGVRIPIADAPEDIVLVVAGGPGRHSAFLPTWGYRTRLVTRRIRFPGETER